MVGRFCAGAANLPFWPMRNYYGSDIPGANPRIKSVKCPYTGDTLATVPALRPDVTIIHAQRADQSGRSGFLGRRRDLHPGPEHDDQHLPEILDKIVNKELGTLVLDNIEILFDQRLKQDPLRLLQLMSRNRSVVAAWNGKIEQGRLIYAETGHPEHRQYDDKDLLFIRMNGTATIDSAHKN